MRDVTVERHLRDLLDVVGLEEQTAEAVERTAADADAAEVAYGAVLIGDERRTCAH